MAAIIRDDGVREYEVEDARTGATRTGQVDLYAARDDLADLYEANKEAKTLAGRWAGYAEWAASVGFPGLSRKAVLDLVTAVRADVDDLAKKPGAPASSAS